MVEGVSNSKKGSLTLRMANKKELPFVIGFSVFGFLVLVGLALLTVWIFRKVCHSAKGYSESEHKKILREVYSAQTLDELFIPAHQLVSAPGTIVHPVTNVNAPFYAVAEQAYVMPAPTEPQFSARPTSASPPAAHLDEGDDDENWDRWDGFPSSAEHVAISTIMATQSAGRGRDNPYFEAEDEQGELPHYYANYAQYSQPPPGYEAVTN